MPSSPSAPHLRAQDDSAHRQPIPFGAPHPDAPLQPTSSARRSSVPWAVPDLSGSFPHPTVHQGPDPGVTQIGWVEDIFADEDGDGDAVPVRFKTPSTVQVLAAAAPLASGIADSRSRLHSLGSSDFLTPSDSPPTATEETFRGSPPDAADDDRAQEMDHPVTAVMDAPSDEEAGPNNPLEPGKAIHVPDVGLTHQALVLAAGGGKAYLLAYNHDANRFFMLSRDAHRKPLERVLMENTVPSSGQEQTLLAPTPLTASREDGRELSGFSFSVACPGIEDATKRHLTSLGFAFDPHTQKLYRHDPLKDRFVLVPETASPPPARD